MVNSMVFNDRESDTKKVKEEGEETDNINWI